MADQKLKVDIIGDASKLNKALNTASGKLQSFGSKVSGVGKRLSIGLSLPLGIAGGAAIKMASDFEESMNKVDVAFGKSSGEVKKFAKTTLSQFGIAQGTALDMAALFGDMSTSMGLTTGEAANMSTALVGLAGDLASFKNMNIQEVTTALNGVFTGETESLKRLGIVMTQVNLQQFAQEQGIQKTLKAMTQAEKVNLRYQFVMAKTTNAQGDFARTSDGAANQMRIFQESIKELGASFGAVILPAFTSLVEKANAVLLKFKNLGEGTKKIIVIIAGVAAAIGPVLVVLGSMSSGIALLSSGFATAVPMLIKVAGAFKTLTIAMLANPVGIIATAVALLTAGFIELLHRLEPSISRVQTFFNLLESLGDPIKFASLQAKSLAESLLEKSKAADEAAKAQENLKNTLSNVNLPLKQADKNTDNLTKRLKGLKSALDGINLDTRKGDLNYETGETAKGSTFVGTQQIETPGTFGLEIPDPNKINDFLKGLISVRKESFKTAEGLQKLSEHKQRMEDLGSVIGNQLGNAFMDLGSTMVKSLGLGESAIGSFAGTFLMAALDAVAAALSVAVAGAIAGAAQGSFLAGPLAPIVLPALIAGGVALIKSAFSSDVPKFANGGIVSGPTLGLMGEYSSAKSNPEVIAPLDKLKGMIGSTGSQNINVGGEFRIQGQDLVVALQRAEKNRSRLL